MFPKIIYRVENYFKKIINHNNKSFIPKDIDFMNGGRNNLDSGGSIKHIGLGILSHDLFAKKITRRQFRNLLCLFAKSFNLRGKDLSHGYTNQMAQSAKGFLNKYDSRLLGSDLGPNHPNDYADNYRWEYDEKYSQKYVSVPSPNKIVHLVKWGNYCEKWFWIYATGNK